MKKRALPFLPHVLAAAAWLSANSPNPVAAAEVESPNSNTVTCGNSALMLSSNRRDLVSIELEDIEMVEVVKMFTKVSGVNIIALPDDLQGRVTVALTDVEPLPALQSILEMHYLELIERTQGAGVYCIVRPLRYGSMKQLLYRVPGDTQPVHAVSLDVTNATFGQVLSEIAQQARINICCESALANSGDLTICYTNADASAVLSQLAEAQGISMAWSLKVNGHVLGVPPVITPKIVPVTAPPSSSPAPPGNEPWIVLAIFVGASFLTLVVGIVPGRRRRSDEPDPAVPAQWKSRTGVALLSFVYGILIFEAAATDFLGTDYYLLKILAGGSAVAVALFALAMRGINAFRKRGHAPTGKWKLLVWLLAILPLGIFFADSAPIKSDYDWDDLPVPASDAQETYRLLGRIWGPKAIRVRLSEPNLDVSSSNVLAFADQIERHWKEVSDVRETVEKLATFPAIADLTVQDERKRGLYVSRYSSFVTFRALFHAYRCRIELRTAQGRLDEAVADLTTWHSFVRKLLPYNRSFIMKMMCIGAASGNISLAHSIVQHPQCDSNTLASLAEVFRPLSPSDASVRQQFLTEYLTHKELITRLKATELRPLLENSFPRYPADGLFIRPKPPSVPEGILSRLVLALTFKRNATIDDVRAHYQLMMDCADETPPALWKTERRTDEYFHKPRLTNLAGWFYVVTCVPSFTRATKSCADAKVLSDLLALEIQDRLGQKLELMDYYLDSDPGTPYSRDSVTHAWYSAGPDKIPGTQDDIRLPASE